MSFSLEFVHTVPGKSREDAFPIIDGWLRDEDAKVKESAPPSRIVAAHGRALQPMGWRKDARKTMAFDLVPAGADVTVNVKITPASLNASDVRMRSDEARANWSELLTELWARFGESEAPAEAVRSLGIDWSASLRRGKGTATAGAVLLVLGVAAFVLFFPSPLAYVGTGIIVAGALSLMYGGMTVRSAKARLAGQRPRS